MDAPAIGESRDDKQSMASDILTTSRADHVLEPAALVDYLAANDAVVESKSEHDLAMSMLEGVAHEL
jgi:ERCC4-type nuclease